MAITVASLKALSKAKGGTRVEKLGKRGCGVIEVTGQASGAVTAAFRYADGGKRARLALGAWDERVTGQSLADIKGKALRLSERLRNGEDLRPAGPTGTLGELLDAYIGTLAGLTARDAGNIFRRDVPDQYRSMPAAAITGPMVRDWLAAMVERGCSRQVNKARSYLHAAFSRVLRSGKDPRGAASMATFGLTTNPVADGSIRVAEYDRALDRVLTDAEIKTAWEALPDTPAGDAVKLSILLGGQRSTQISHATRQGDSVRMLDTKGKRAQPRVHVVPAVGAAFELIHHVDDGERIFPTVTPEQIRAAFPHYRHLRRTIETRMIELGISSDIRAQIQSHGLSGVQTRHYDRAQYGPQIANALERLHQWFDGVLTNGCCTNVVAIKSMR